MTLKCKSTKFDSVLTVLCRIHRKCVPKYTLVKYIFAGPFLSILDATLFMPNQILRRFIKKIIDFHKKIAKIEDFKVDYMYSKLTTKKLLILSIILRIHQIYYRISYTKNHGLGNLVVFFRVVNFEVFYLCEFLMKSNIFFLQIASEFHLA